MVARYDAFADALTAGVLLPQAPLLLVPSQGPLPQAVSEELRRLGATQATILGGTAAVGAGVEAELGGLGLATTRLAGGDRVATAVAVAGFGARQAGTALLVRPHAGHPRRPRRRPHRDRALRRGGRRAPPARRRRCARRLRPGASYPVRRLDDPRTPPTRPPPPAPTPTSPGTAAACGQDGGPSRVAADRHRHGVADARKRRRAHPAHTAHQPRPGHELQPVEVDDARPW